MRYREGGMFVLDELAILTGPILHVSFFIYCP